jgi:hypothetical protein
MLEENNVKFYMKDRVLEIRGEDGKVRHITPYIDFDSKNLICKLHLAVLVSLILKTSF